MFGYAGKILEVNLTNSEIGRRVVEEDLVRNFLGGNGFSSKVLFYELAPETPPFSSENKLIFMTGPLTGTLVPMASRYHVQAKSPLTGIWGQGDSGGFWGAELKYAGLDGIIIDGVADKPVYLCILDEEAEIRDAKEIWGMTTDETQTAVKEDLGKDVKVLTIGPAGENLVKIATIVNDGSRTAGRSGLGAVMGFKKLKAIAIKGKEEVEVADVDKLKELRTQMIKDLKEGLGFQGLHEYGTSSGSLEWTVPLRNLPLKNWQQDTWDVEKVRSIGGKSMRERIYVKSEACYGCPIGCGKIVQVKEGPFRTEAPSKLEYETMAALGPLCLNDNLEAIAKANDMCNRYGMDTIETGAIIAFAMECYERRIISRQDAGIEVKWGDGDAMVKLIDMMCKRQGLGNILAQGLRGAAEMIGKSASECAMHVKGSAICMHDPRSPLKPGIALKYAVGNIGAYHGLGETLVNPFANPRDIAHALAKGQNWAEVVDCLVMCTFAFESWAGALPYELYIPELISAVTGRQINVNELLEIGERIYTMKRYFNTKLGIRKRDDKLPKRFKEIPRILSDGKKLITDVEPQLVEYYKVRGWDDEGIPTNKKLKKLGVN
jgi:aldehyde:ferredoxin oxidoreductase